MACYCPSCQFLYSEGTTHCFSCGRLLSRDNRSPRSYIQEGYAPFDDEDPTFDGDSHNTQPEPVQPHGPAVPPVNSGEPAQSDLRTPAPASSPTSVFTGAPVTPTPVPTQTAASSVPPAAPVNPGNVLQGEGVAAESFQATNYQAQEDARYRQLIADQQRRQRQLEREIRRQRRRQALLAFPWRAFFRVLLVVLILIGLAVAWFSRDAILNAPFNLATALGSWVLSLIISLLPTILVFVLVVYLFRALFRS